MTITPCRTCHLTDGCGLRLEKIKAVRGLKLTAIKFKCSLLKDSLKPGMKVLADLQYVATGYETHYQEETTVKTEKRTVDAFVMAWSGDKVRIYIPYEDDCGWWLQSIQNESVHLHVLRVHPNQLHPYSEQESVSVCVHCGFPEGADVANWQCGRFDSNGESLGCEYAWERK